MHNCGVQHVAFFRNVNQGQRGQPRTPDLIDAFGDAGIPDAVAFQSNGTVLFAADDVEGTVVDVRSSLTAKGIYSGEVFTRPLSFIRAFVARYGDRPNAHRYELTLFPDGQLILDENAAMQEARRRRCELIDHGRGWAAVCNDRDARSNGTPTIEAVLSVPATSRGLPTLARLVHRFSR